MNINEFSRTNEYLTLAAKITGSTVGCCHADIVLQLPITIGTRPIRNNTYRRQRSAPEVSPFLVDNVDSNGMFEIITPATTTTPVSEEDSDDGKAAKI